MRRPAASPFAIAIGGLAVMGFAGAAWAQPSPGAAMQGLVGGAPPANHAPPSRGPDRKAQAARHDNTHPGNRATANASDKHAKGKKAK